MLSTASALQPIIVQLRETAAYMRKTYDNIEKIDNVNNGAYYVILHALNLSLMKGFSVVFQHLRPRHMKEPTAS